MGADIHTRFETKAKAGQTGDEFGWCKIDTEYDENRHYLLFAILAGVRNGWSTLGSGLNSPISMVADLRGLPNDLSGYDPRVDWEFGDHSYTWLMGSEILEWAKLDRMIVQSGIISREQYQSWDGGKPDGYGGFVAGNGVVTISDPVSRDKYSGPIDMRDCSTSMVHVKSPEWTHIRVWWVASVNEQIGYFINEIKSLVDKHGDIRMTMGFDS